MSRRARNDRELAIAQALTFLAGLDGDRARERNGEGFSKFDGEFGHSLAEQLQRTGALTDRQWLAAERLAKKYRRQVGELPK